MKLFLSFLTLLFSVAISDAIPGDQGSVQNAINSASPGSTVTIDNGSYNWTNTVTISKAIKLEGQSRNGVKISFPNGTVNGLDVTEPPSGKTEIANLTIDWQKAPDVWPFAIAIRPANPRGSGRVLLHDCTISTNYAYGILWSANGGVVFNCVFDGTHSSGLSGISFVVRDEWKKVSTVGTRDTDGLGNTYIEDCVFKNAQIGMCNLDDNSRVVFRHCEFENAEIGSHGQETSVDGCRQWEIYDNNFACDPENKWNLNCYLMLRGGTGIITNNAFQDIPWGKTEIQLNVFSIRRMGQIPCQTSYPAARQVGQGWIGAGGYSYPSVPSNGTGYTTDPVCIWANSGPHEISLPDYEPDECGNGQHTADYVKLGRDYLLNAPPSGYTKYPFPHPLRENGGGGPTPTPSATPTPNPSPSPSPSATPNPGETYTRWLNALSDWIRAHPAVPDK